MNKIMLFLILIFSLYSELVFSKEEVLQLSQLKLHDRHEPQARKMSHLEFTLAQIKNIEKNFRKLKSRIDNNEIVGLELLIADTTKSQIESRFGHALFRFVDKNRLAGNDLVIGFVAQVDTPILNYFKGVFGGYALVPEVRPLRDFHQQYSVSQQRFLDRYVLSSDDNLRKLVFDKLREQWMDYYNVFKENISIKAFKAQKRAQRYAKRKKGVVKMVKGFNGNTLGFLVAVDDKVYKIFPIKFKLSRSKVPKHYTFLQNNCSGAIVKLLRSAGLTFLPKMSLHSIIPVKLANFLTRHHLIHFQVPKIPVVFDVMPVFMRLTEMSFKDLKALSSKQITALVDQFLEDLPDGELFVIIDNFNLSEGVFNSIINRISIDTFPRYEDIYGIQMHNLSLYNICLEKECVKNFSKDYYLVKKRKHKYPRRKMSKFLETLLMQTSNFSANIILN